MTTDARQRLRAIRQKAEQGLSLGRTGERAVRLFIYCEFTVQGKTWR